MEIVGFVFAFFIGLVMGLVGAGGSILSSSILVYVFGFSPVLSASYTLLNVGIISMVGSVQYYNRKLVDLRSALSFALPALVMIFFMRKFIMPAIPEKIIQVGQFALTKNLLTLLVFAVLMILISYSMIRSSGEPDPKPAAGINYWVLALLGLGVAVLTGFAGAGGGFVIVPSLVFFASMDVKKAVGTSLFIICLNTLFGFCVDFSSGATYDWNFLCKFIGITVAGMILSNQFLQKFKSSQLKRAFGFTILVMGCWILVKELFIRK